LSLIVYAAFVQKQSSFSSIYCFY